MVSALKYSAIGSARPAARVCLRASSTAPTKSGNHGISNLALSPPRRRFAGWHPRPSATGSSPGAAPVKASQLRRHGAQQIERIATEDLVDVRAAEAAAGQELGQRGELGVAGQDGTVVRVHIRADGHLAGPGQVGQADDLVGEV